MSQLQEIAQFEQEIGKDVLRALINNPKEAWELGRKLFLNSLPPEMTIGERTYKFHNTVEFRNYKKRVSGDAVIKRAIEIDANLGQEDGEYILKHQGDIPEVFRGKVTFVFPDWRNPNYNNQICIIYWSDNDDYWLLDFNRLDSDDWGGTSCSLAEWNHLEIIDRPSFNQDMLLSKTA